MIGDPQLFNSEAKKAWKNAIQLMFIQFGEVVSSNVKLDRWNR